MAQLKDYVIVQPKSKIKAGEGLVEGKYKFFTSSNIQTKWLNEFQYDKPALIFGTGGMASVHYCDTPFSTSTDCIVMYAKDNANLEYIYCYLESHMGILEEGFKGAGLKHISKDYILNIQIPKNELPEQRKIVDLFNHINSTILSYKKQLEKLDKLVKSRFIEMFGDPVDNPLHWNKKQLQEVVTDDCSISYGIVQTGDEQQDGVPVFRPIDIVNRIPKLNELKKTTKEISDKYKRTILKGRELLITVRANIADTCVVGAEFKDCNVGRGIVPIRTKENIIILEFLKHQLDSKHLNDNIKELAKGIALVQLNMEDLRQVELILPPIELQNEFLQFAKQTDKLKFDIQQSLEKLETLKKSLMQQYFG